MKNLGRGTVPRTVRPGQWGVLRPVSPPGGDVCCLSIPMCSVVRGRLSKSLFMEPVGGVGGAVTGAQRTDQCILWPLVPHRSDSPWFPGPLVLKETQWSK